MPRKLRVPKERVAKVEISEGERYVLLHGELPPRPNLWGDDWKAWDLLYDTDRCRALWSVWREELLASWITDTPGTRPYAWWLIDAPRAYVDGIATPCAEARAHVGGCGRPVLQGVNAWLVSHSRGTPFFTDIDPNDPPRIESQAQYLRRFALLTFDELQRLTPAVFQAETEIRLDSGPFIPWWSGRRVRENGVLE